MHDHAETHKAPQDERSARRRDLYLAKINTHKRQTSMLPEGFEPATPANERPQTHALYHATTWTVVA